MTNFSIDKIHSGAFYIQTPDGTEEEVLHMGDVREIEFTASADETVPIRHLFNNSAELSFSVDAMDLDMLSNLCGPTMPTDNFTIEYNAPIMIQARWHKKARIRKKWLKRFGMKPDTVKCALCINDVHTISNYELAFEINVVEFTWRPDQKRKDLKIEW